MDLSRGCVLVARSLDESDIFQNEKWLKVWIWCLIQANHKGKNVPVNIGRSTTVVWVDRGQFIFGRNKSAEKLNMPPSTVRNIIEMFSKKPFKNLDIQRDSHYSLITIVDFDFYQDLNNYKGQAEGQPMDKRRTADGQPMDTTIYEKQPKNEKKKDILKPESVSDQIWNDWLKHRKNKKAIVTEGVLKTFSEQAKLCGYTLEQAMKESIDRGWAGFKADWVKNVTNNKQNDGNTGSNKALLKALQTEEKFNE